MYNAEKPNLDDLPSTAQLLRSTIIAFVGAVVILVTIVLPAEYGIDPTGIGRVLDLTEMGEIKQELAEEAERDRQLDEAAANQSSMFEPLFGLLVGAAHAQEGDDAQQATADGDAWTDEFSFTLTPGEGIGWKLVMEEGAAAEFSWVAEGGRVNFDLHGHGPGGQSVTYERGRGSTGANGTFTAAFAGDHGWFWRNRDSQDVTVNVSLRGDYSELKQND